MAGRNLNLILNLNLNLNIDFSFNQDPAGSENPSCRPFGSVRMPDETEKKGEPGGSPLWGLVACRYRGLCLETA